MTDLSQPLSFTRGPAMKNRFMLAPLTNWQSHPDGRLSDEEVEWLTHRATGGFGLVMTAAAHVQRTGQGFPGQLGVFGDDHLDGLTRLAAAIRAKGALSAVQLHHAGIRSPADLIGEAPVGPSEDASVRTPLASCSARPGCPPRKASMASVAVRRALSFSSLMTSAASRSNADA